MQTQQYSGVPINNALAEAVVEGNIQLVTDLLLVEAVKEGNKQLVADLLKKPITNPASGNNAALYYSIYCGHFDIFKLLLNDPRTIDLNSETGTMLELASKLGYNEMVNHLLKSSLHKVDNSLNYAIIAGKFSIVKILLNKEEYNTDDFILSKAKELALKSDNELIKELFINYPL
jgi:ankyrin repeat protein